LASPNQPPREVPIAELHSRSRRRVLGTPGRLVRRLAIATIATAIGSLALASPSFAIPGMAMLPSPVAF
jgi:hypothetical protein